MIEKLNVEEKVEFLERIWKRICGGGEIIDIEDDLGWMDFRKLDIGGGGVREDKGWEKERNRLEEKKEEEENVEKEKKLKRERRVRVEVEIREEILIDIGKKCRIEFVKREEFKMRIKKLRGDERKMIDIGRVDGGEGSIGNINIMKKRNNEVM